jgi:hypothetical protein
MKKIIIGLFIVISLFIISGCNRENDKSNQINDNLTNEKVSDAEMTDIKVTIDNKTYNLHLEDNETAKSFVDLIPQEFQMSELNGNEKYIYMDNSLPTNSSDPKHINAGDVMLYGDNCLVIFYQSFDTNYSYTKIGHIDNLSDLGNDSVEVRIEK